MAGVASGRVRRCPYVPPDGDVDSWVPGEAGARQVGEERMMVWRSKPSTCMGDAEHCLRRDELKEPRFEAKGDGREEPPGDTLIGDAFPRYRSSPSGAGRSRRSV